MPTMKDTMLAKLRWKPHGGHACRPHRLGSEPRVNTCRPPSEQHAATRPAQDRRRNRREVSGHLRSLRVGAVWTRPQALWALDDGAGFLALPGGSPWYFVGPSMAGHIGTAAGLLPSVWSLTLALVQSQGMVSTACPPWGLALIVRMWAQNRRHNLSTTTTCYSKHNQTTTPTTWNQC